MPSGLCIGGKKADRHKVAIIENGLKYEIQLNNGTGMEYLLKTHFLFFILIFKFYSKYYY